MHPDRPRRISGSLAATVLGVGLTACGVQPRAGTAPDVRGSLPRLSAGHMRGLVPEGGRITGVRTRGDTTQLDVLVEDDCSRRPRGFSIPKVTDHVLELAFWAHAPTGIVCLDVLRLRAERFTVTGLDGRTIRIRRPSTG